MATKKSTATTAKTKKSAAKAADTKATAQAPAKATPNVPSTVVLTARLRTWNKFMALLFVVQAVAVGWLGNATATPVATQYLTVDPLATEAAGHQVLATASRQLFDLRITWVVVALLGMLALWHFALATVYRKRYEAELASGVSRARWLGLGVGGAVMMVVLAALSGVHTGALLLFMAGAILLGAGLTDASLRLKQAEHRPLTRALCWTASIVTAAPWLVLLANVCGALRYGGTIPMYLYALYITMFLLTAAAALAVYFRAKRKGRWADGYYHEQSLMILGIAAVSLLTWQVFAGVLYP